ncbi:MAG: hypothetical protein H6660_10845 [Ardenticatenaceae bacterium]|nr:hypothetical protein [Ardenticatenaceae bacterium]
MDNAVYALAWDAASSTLFAGGNFTTAGGNSASRIASWDGSSWSALGAGVDSPIFALAWDAASSTLFAGGNLTTAGGNAASRIASWDGSSWSALGTGVDNTVTALAWDGASSTLFVGGTFITAGGNPASRIASWNGSSWSALGTGMNFSVHALAWDAASNTLFAGGNFTTAGDNPASRIASWNGSSWSALGAGMNSTVAALAWDAASNTLFAGGSFITAGGDPASGIASWDGSSWSALGSGVDNSVAALAWDADGDYSSLYVGGNFVNAGGKSSAYLGRWRNAAIWDGGGSDNNASTAANWSGDTVPATSDVAVFDSTSSKNSILDGSFSATLGGLVVESGYTGTISHHRSISLTGNLEVYSGTLALADPSVYTFIVGGSVIHTGGIISQTRPVNNADMPFLQIEDSAAAVKYRGVEIDTSGFGNDLGDVTVMVQAVDTTNNEYCTSALPAGLPYAGRCYTINPTHNLPADLTFWALTSEITVISPTITAPAIYRHVPPWAKLASTTGTNGDYTWVKAMTPGFSSFLIGEDTNAPTAVSDTITTTANSPVFIDVLANDLPGGNGAPTLQSVGQPMNGTAVISGTGIIYTVNLNFVGLDTFTYTISDGLFVSTTTVTVTISPVNNPTFIYLPLILRNP